MGAQRMKNRFKTALRKEAMATQIGDPNSAPLVKLGGSFAVERTTLLVILLLIVAPFAAA